SAHSSPDAALMQASSHRFQMMLIPAAKMANFTHSHAPAQCSAIPSPSRPAKSSTVTASSSPTYSPTKPFEAAFRSVAADNRDGLATCEPNLFLFTELISTGCTGPLLVREEDYAGVTTNFGQFGVGSSIWSMTKICTGPFLASSLRPSCSRRAIAIGGNAELSGRLTAGSGRGCEASGGCCEANSRLTSKSPMSPVSSSKGRSKYPPSHATSLSIGILMPVPISPSGLREIENIPQ